jgi:hypothetical protein
MYRNLPYLGALEKDDLDRHRELERQDQML